MRTNKHNKNPPWKNNNDFPCSCPRDWRLSASWGPIEGLPQTWIATDHHSGIFFRGFRGSYFGTPMGIFPMGIFRWEVFPSGGYIKAHPHVPEILRQVARSCFIILKTRLTFGFYFIVFSIRNWNLYLFKFISVKNNFL